VPDKLLGAAVAVVLDATIFHPQGGGQPTDVGAITAADGRVFRVTMSKAAGDVITHTGTFVDGAAPFAAGEAVSLAIDGGARRLHARIHSAGHALDVALATVALTSDAAKALVPTKGYHFPDGPTVEYKGKVDPAEADALVAQLQAALDKVIADDVPTSQRVIPATEVDPQYLGTGFPMDAQVRVVGVAGKLMCPCGGTHVMKSSELGAVKLEKLKTKKGATKLYYSVGA